MNDTNTQANPKKLFVGNLPYSTTEQELVDLFSQYGELVSVAVITDRMTGRAKGIAFVEFASEEAAAQAIEATNNMDLNGRNIMVNVARPMQPREKRPFQSGGYGNSRGGFDRRGGGRDSGRGGRY